MAKARPSPEAVEANGAAELHGWRNTLRALRHRNFQLFFGGQFISLVGTWMQNIAQDWLVYRLTGSSLLLGVVGFASQIPIFLLGPVGGIIADRFNRQRTVIATQAASMVLALALAVLTLTGTIRVWEIMILASLLGVVNAVDIPARQSFLIEMVGRDDLLNAIGLNSSIFNGARVVGPAIAGLVVAGIGEGWCFFVNGVSYIAVIAGLTMMRITHQTALQQHGSPMENLVEGLRFARQTAPVRSLLLLIGLISIGATPYTILMPIFAGRILHGDARVLGILMGATGVGALIGALTIASKKTVQGLGRFVWTSSIGLGASLVLFAISKRMWLSIPPLVLVGFSILITAGATNTLLQAMSPDRLRGRVMALYSMMFVGMTPVGALLAGVVADKIGAPWTVGIGGVACLVGGAIFARHLPVIRGEARQLLRAQGMIPPEPATPVSLPRT